MECVPGRLANSLDICDIFNLLTVKKTSFAAFRQIVKEIVSFHKMWRHRILVPLDSLNNCPVLYLLSPVSVQAFQSTTLE